MMLKLLYSVLFSLLLPIIFLRLLIRSRNSSEHRKGWLQRLGLNTLDIHKPVIWVHAVSLGETVAVGPLVKEILRRYPEFQILVTNMTATGAEKTKQLFGGDVVSQYIPYDVPFLIKPFIKRLSPRLVIISETELWPNMLQQCASQQVPVLLANARMNARSARRYLKAGKIAIDMLERVSAYAVQTQIDYEQFLALGIAEHRLTLTGNLKFEQRVPGVQVDQGKTWHQEFARPVWVAASTHDGEEGMVLEAHRQLLKTVPNALLILVPRHPERFESVAQTITSMDFSVCRHSLSQMPTDKDQVWLGDTMGNLFAYYSAADIAFVGGSLVNIGGHSPVEPAAIGLPILMGPYVHKCLQVHDELVQKGSLISIDESGFSEVLLRLFASHDVREEMSQSALTWVSVNQGATAKHIGLVEQLLNQGLESLG